ncbi:MAG: hypothetical protein M1832_005637 [Thelocarpon impressellum]|nr:MAG: hypothetical protein M1832_005637 [Thelocarpon impressellum]
MKVRHPSEAVFFDLMTEAGLCQAGNMTITVPTGEDQDLVGAPEKVDIYAFRAMA